MWILMAFSDSLREEAVDPGVPRVRRGWENDQITLH